MPRNSNGPLNETMKEMSKDLRLFYNSAVEHVTTPKTLEVTAVFNDENGKFINHRVFSYTLDSVFKQ